MADTRTTQQKIDDFKKALEVIKQHQKNKLEQQQLSKQFGSRGEGFNLSSGIGIPSVSLNLPGGDSLKEGSQSGILASYDWPSGMEQPSVPSIDPNELPVGPGAGFAFGPQGGIPTLQDSIRQQARNDEELSASELANKVSSGITAIRLGGAKLPSAIPILQGLNTVRNLWEQEGIDAGNPMIRTPSGFWNYIASRPGAWFGRALRSSLPIEGQDFLNKLIGLTTDPQPKGAPIPPGSDPSFDPENFPKSAASRGILDIIRDTGQSGKTTPGQITTLPVPGQITPVPAPLPVQREDFDPPPDEFTFEFSEEDLTHHI